MGVRVVLWVWVCGFLGVLGDLGVFGDLGVGVWVYLVGGLEEQ